MGDNMTIKENINKLFSGRKIPIISRILMTLKIFIFLSLITTAMIMYKIGSIQWGNDILIVAVLLVILNKLDNMNS